MPGSASKAPIRIETCAPSGQVPPKRLAAHRAEGFARALALAVDPNEISAREQAELLAADTRLGKSECARVLPAARAMAMAGANEWWIDFEADGSAEATSGDDCGKLRCHD